MVCTKAEFRAYTSEIPQVFKGRYSGKGRLRNLALVSFYFSEKTNCCFELNYCWLISHYSFFQDCLAETLLRRYTNVKLPKNIVDKHVHVWDNFTFSIKLLFDDTALSKRYLKILMTKVWLHAYMSVEQKCFEDISNSKILALKIRAVATASLKILLISDFCKSSSVIFSAQLHSLSIGECIGNSNFIFAFIQSSKFYFIFRTCLILTEISSSFHVIG